MRLLLVQHGEARHEADDPTRPLTEQGVEAVTNMAFWAERAGVRVDQIRHSGKKRAEQTAMILADQLHPTDGVVAVEGLNPADDPGAIASRIWLEEGSIMLVGHLPFLGRLTGLLISGQPERSVVRFQNGGIVQLSNDDGPWTIDWVMFPELVASQLMSESVIGSRFER